jgi:predicted flap endonuclease-1-like 5' DNA nuclease
MKLVSENDADFVKDTVRSAKEKYASDSKNTKAALDILTKLRGIGPATASLLLSVHDPDHVIFFSDEAFYWLCGGGKEVSIKYNAKEYVALRGAAEKLRERLGVSAIDIEKVADVMMKIGSTVPDKPEHPGKPQARVTDSMPKVESKKSKKTSDNTKPAGEAKPTAASKKRKSEPPVQEGDAVGQDSGLRRSKRNKV